MLVHLENEDFNEMIKDDLVIVDFYANWCGPCKMLSPVLEEISSLRGNVKVVKVDVDKHNELARKYGIMSIPTLMYFKNGNRFGNYIKNTIFLKVEISSQEPQIFFF